jgi:cytochrome c peroxidase
MVKAGVALLATALFLSPPLTVANNLSPIGAVPIPANNSQTPEKIELGKKLFFDRRLSGDGTMSCSTCHDPKQGFSDGLATSLSYPTTKNWRNSPTLINVAYQKDLFHDGRSHSLEEQALFPMMSAFEMNQNLDFLEEEIRAVPEYRQAFTAVFGDSETTRERIAQAIASFQRTLVSAKAPVDKFLEGDDKALSPEAQKGYAIFTGKGGCISCHSGPILSDGKYHALMVEEPPESRDDPRLAATRRFVAKVSAYEDFRNLQEDPGRFLVTKSPRDWKAFRTPTLREVASTGPYMHNGRYQQLQEVVEFFNSGGGAGNEALKPLSLSDEEKAQLHVFLEEGLSSARPAFVYPKIP